MPGVGVEPIPFSLSLTGLATVPDARLYGENRNNALHIKTSKIWKKHKKRQKKGIEATPLYTKPYYVSACHWVGYFI